MSNTQFEQRIVANLEHRTLEVPHLGVSLRTLFGAAANANPDPSEITVRRWVLLYKDCDIGQIQLRTT